MNYVAHTRAAHEHLSRQAQARPHHVSLYWALFFDWNAARFPASLDLYHPATMRAARIGNERTYRAALYDLDTWKLLAYQPSQSRYGRSRCFLTDLSQSLPAIAGTSAPDEPVAPAALVPPMPPGTTGTSAPDEALPSEAELPPINPSTGGTSARHEKGASGAVLPQALQAQVPPMLPSSGALVPEDTLYSKTKGLNSVVVNGSGGGAKKKLEVLEGEGLSSAELLDEPNPPNGADQAQTAAPKKTPRIERGARKKKGVGGATTRDAAQAQTAAANPPPKRGQPHRPEVPFAESALASYENFAAAFAGTDYELADLRFYHAQVANWRKNGEPPRRRDWKATATQFMLNDAHDNRLKLAPNPHANNTAGPGTLFARTGFRSKYDA
ncbi:hypothetical protein [Hymenobacter psychrophilus]|uniref:Uncharacterized protein n=1 Tax=Hymenobacter psychrophilus TaxID=651662 RepID=A0A1H3LUI3_9BACT|nr:hypothetical protein [Hymenobacter psychrophilus]SDY68016.1 hypothetical protein SAMN04488069_111138 [Hymenobacter psychrophilus]